MDEKLYYYESYDVAVIGAGDVNKLTRALAGTLELES